MSGVHGDHGCGNPGCFPWSCVKFYNLISGLAAIFQRTTEGHPHTSVDAIIEKLWGSKFVANSLFSDSAALSNCITRKYKVLGDKGCCSDIVHVVEILSICVTESNITT